MLGGLKLAKQYGMIWKKLPWYPDSVNNLKQNWTGSRTKRPTVYRGIRSRLTRSQKYAPARLDLSVYQVPTPDNRKKSSITQGQIKPRISTKRSPLCSGFFNSHPSVSKKRVQWQRKIASMAIILSQSMSYLRSCVIFSYLQLSEFPIFLRNLSTVQHIIDDMCVSSNFPTFPFPYEYQTQLQ